MNINKNNSFYDLFEDTSYAKSILKIKEDIKLNKNIYVYCDDYRLLNDCNEISLEYKIYVFNPENPLESDYYNPFHLLSSDIDVIDLTNFISSYIHCCNNSNLLLMSCIFYLIRYRPKEEQNFTSVMKLLRAAKVDKNNQNTKSPLDRLFEEVARNDPKSIALNCYEPLSCLDKNIINNLVCELTNKLMVFNVKKIQDLTNYNTIKFSKPNEKQIIIIKNAKNQSLKLIMEIFFWQLSKFIDKNSEVYISEYKNNTLEQTIKKYNRDYTDHQNGSFI